MRRIGKSERGQALVEMAIVTPLLLMLILGIVQFGILFNNYITLTDAVRAGARQAAVSRQNPDPVGATAARVRKSAAGLDGDKLTITVTPYDPQTGTNTWVSGGDVTVKATYPFKVDIIGLVVHDGDLESVTTERVE